MSGSSSDDERRRTDDETPDDSNRPSSSNVTALATTSAIAASNHAITMSQELPFLVTHWLANFAAASLAGSAPPGAGSSQLGGAPAPAVQVSSADVSSAGATAEEREEAVRCLQRAAGDIASAFTTLGIFGSATTVSA